MIPIDLDRLRRGRIVIVGLGGIGSFLAPVITMFIASLQDLEATIVFIDGDDFEERNRSRMEVPELGNKARVLCGEMIERHARPGLTLRPVDRFICEENVEDLVRDGDIVLSCVDNHATRKLLSDRAETLVTVTLISGGNDGVEGEQRGTYGNIQVMQRRDGVEQNPPLTRYHPEIATPGDELPSLSCSDLATTSAPQIVFTNLFAAAAMGAAFFRLHDAEREGVIYDEACFDIEEGKMVPLQLAAHEDAGEESSPAGGATA